MLQPTATAPVDAEMLWTVYLRSVLVGRPESYAQNVKVVRDVPSERPGRFVAVTRDGGSVTGVFDNPRIRLDVWADSEKNATDLANLLVGLALVAPLSLPGCTNVTHQAGPNAVPDPSKQPRRLALIEAQHRATIITV